MQRQFLHLLNDYDDLLSRLAVEQHQRHDLSKYLALLWERNKRLNLVSRRIEPAQLVTDHLLDSLIALPHIPSTPVMADLGSGGGFPAVPLAICRPETRLLLYEKSPLKCGFLRELVSFCPNLEIRGLLEPSGLPRDVTAVTARAFKSLSQILGFTRDYYQRGGFYFLYKGRRARIDEEIRETDIGIDKLRVIALEPVGQIEERHLILVNG